MLTLFIIDFSQGLDYLCYQNVQLKMTIVNFVLQPLTSNVNNVKIIWNHWPVYMDRLKSVLWLFDFRYFGAVSCSCFWTNNTKPPFTSKYTMELIITTHNFRNSYYSDSKQAITTERSKIGNFYLSIYLYLCFGSISGLFGKYFILRHQMFDSFTISTTIV